MKISFLGAGSIGFTQTLVRDILKVRALQNIEISLHDISKKNLTFLLLCTDKFFLIFSHSFNTIIAVFLLFNIEIFFSSNIFEKLFQNFSKIIFRFCFLTYFSPR